MLLGRRQVRLEPVVVFLRDRLELVVVAAGTADRQPEERRADDVGPLGQDLVAAERDLGVAGVPPHRAEPVEDRRGLALAVLGRDLVAGDLLDHEAVERLVAVQASRSRSRGTARRRGCGGRTRSPRSRRSGPRRASAAPSARRSAGWPAGGRRPARRRPGTRSSSNASISSGVGGRPVRSNVTRRIHSARLGRRRGTPAAASRAGARTKASIGFWTQAASATVRRAGFFTGWNAQCSRACCIGESADGRASRPAGESARRRRPTSRSRRSSRSGSLGFFGGIARPSSCRIAWISRLSPALPGTTAGPVSPPWSIAARESSRSPPAELLRLGRVAAVAFRLQHRLDLLAKEARPVARTRVGGPGRGSGTHRGDQEDRGRPDRSGGRRREGRIRHDASTSARVRSWAGFRRTALYRRGADGVGPAADRLDPRRPDPPGRFERFGRQPGRHRR